MFESRSKFPYEGLYRTIELLQTWPSRALQTNFVNVFCSTKEIPRFNLDDEIQNTPGYVVRERCANSIFGDGWLFSDLFSLMESQS